MNNGMRKKHTQVPKCLENFNTISSRQSGKMLFLRNKDVVVSKGYPVIIKKKNDAPAPTVYVEPGQKGIFSGVSPFVGKVVAYGMVIVSLVTFGWIGTNTTHAQEKPKTEQGGKPNKLSWGDVKAKFRAPETKVAEKTWVEKGEKKYDVTYENGVVTFVKWDGSHDASYDMKTEPKLRDIVSTPLKTMWHRYADGYGNGVWFVYDKGMVFLMPERGQDGEAYVRIMIKTKPENSQASLSK